MKQTVLQNGYRRHLVGEADAGVVPGEAVVTQRTHGEHVPALTHLLPSGQTQRPSEAGVRLL